MPKADLKKQAQKAPSKSAYVRSADSLSQLNFKVDDAQFITRVKIAAASTHMTMREYLKEAVEEKLNRDGF